MGHMPIFDEQFALRVLSGERTGAVAGALRGITAAIEPVYAAVVSARNRLYDAGVFRSHDLGRPVISVGNITTGGTGKTPVVAWLARRLVESGHTPAVLIRGYKSAGNGGISDEAEVLRALLPEPASVGTGIGEGADRTTATANADRVSGTTGADRKIATANAGRESATAGADRVSATAGPGRTIAAADADRVIVAVGADRVAAAAGVLRDRADVSVFILDDGMQHRRVRRQFELTLIDACRPFGFDHVASQSVQYVQTHARPHARLHARLHVRLHVRPHVLPRGLLREPMRGLGRADAFLITHASEAPPSKLDAIVAELSRHNPAAGVYYCDHQIAGLIDADDIRRPVDILRGRKYAVACGIGNPAAFTTAMAKLAGEPAAKRWFADHYAFTAEDLASIRKSAGEAGAECIVVTEKDWVKLKSLAAARDGAGESAREEIVGAIAPGGDRLPVLRASLEIAFRSGDERRLLEKIMAVALGGHEKKTTTDL
jgi:tetraacyldisaccharide 4'-kinase